MKGPQDASALVEHVRASQARECESLLAEARAEAARVVSAAFRAAREAVGAVVAEERGLMTREETLAAARVHTARREHLQRRQQALLAAAMHELETVLTRRWQERDTARAWIRQLCADAHARLPSGEWTLVHGEDWSEVHAGVCGELLRRDPTRSWHTELDAAIAAGLRIKSGGVVVDGTLQALLADVRLQADVLAALDVHDREVANSP